MNRVQTHQPPNSDSSSQPSDVLQRLFANPSPFMSLDFPERPPDASSHLAPIGGIPYNTQESIVVKELLSVLQGYHGDYIYGLPLDTVSSPRTFHVDPSIHSSFQQHIQELLPCAVSYSYLARFVDGGMDYRLGMVMHALVYALKHFIMDYRHFLGNS